MNKQQRIEKLRERAADLDAKITIIDEMMRRPDFLDWHELRALATAVVILLDASIALEDEAHKLARPWQSRAWAWIDRWILGIDEMEGY